VRYGLGVVATSVQAFLQRKEIARFRIFDPNGRRLDPEAALDSGLATSTG
jgi:hypothetical protein